MDAVTWKTWPRWNAARTRLVAWGATLGLLAIGALLLARRVVGAIRMDLDPMRLVATAAIAATTVVACRMAWRRGDGATSPEATAFGWCGTISLWALTVGCAPPTWHAATWMLWLPFVTVDQVSRQRFSSARAVRHRSDVDAAVAPVSVPIGETAKPDGDRVVQEMMRLRTAEGVEQIRGTLRAEFAAGQRHATIHVGFCPPLARMPVLEVELVDGPDAAVKVTQALAHGAQIELRLAEPAEETCSAAVEFRAAPSAPDSQCL